MNVPSKYLFYDGLPTARDKDWIMASNGFATLPPLAQIPGGAGSPIDVAGSVGKAPMHGMNLDLQYPKPDTMNNPNTAIDYILAGAGVIDAAIPDGKIHRNYPTTPLPVYNPYPGGTGSQAIMSYGGEMAPFGAYVSGKPYSYGGTAPFGAYIDGDPYAYGGYMQAPFGAYIDGEPYTDGGYMAGGEAKSGNWIGHAVNPKHKGYCTPMSKSTCTPRRKALAKTFKKHHGFHEDGGEVYPMGGTINELIASNVFAGNYGKAVQMKQLGDYLRDGNADQMGTFNQYAGVHANGGVIYDPGNPMYHGSAEAGYQIGDHNGVLEQFLPRMLHGDNGAVLEQFLPRMTGEADMGAVLEQFLPRFTGEAKSGSHLSSAKAKEILRDGTAQGHPLTAKQKRYFGWVAGGGKAQGGMQVDPGGPKKPISPLDLTGGGWGGTNADTKKANLSDLISRNLVNTGDPADLRRSQGVLYRMAEGKYGKENAIKLMDEINLYNKRPEIKGYSPEQKIQNFYDMQSNNPNVQGIKKEFKNFGINPLSLYHNTHDVDVNKQQGSIAKSMEMGGYASGGYEEGSMHDLPEEHIAKLLKAGYKIQYL